MIMAGAYPQRNCRISSLTWRGKPCARRPQLGEWVNDPRSVVSCDCLLQRHFPGSLRRHLEGSWRELAHLLGKLQRLAVCTRTADYPTKCRIARSEVGLSRP